MKRTSKKAKEMQRRVINARRRAARARKRTFTTGDGIRFESVPSRKTARALLVDLAEQLRASNDALAAERAKVAKLTVDRDPPFIWTTRDGEQMACRELDDRHLQNTIFFLVRTLVHHVGTARWLRGIQPRVRALYEMLKEAERRGLDV